MRTDLAVIPFCAHTARNEFVIDWMFDWHVIFFSVKRAGGWRKWWTWESRVVCESRMQIAGRTVKRLVNATLRVLDSTTVLMLTRITNVFSLRLRLALLHGGTASITTISTETVQVRIALWHCCIVRITTGSCIHVGLRLFSRKTVKHVSRTSDRCDNVQQLHQNRSVVHCIRGYHFAQSFGSVNIRLRSKKCGIESLKNKRRLCLCYSR